jgi:hypothetical protein
MTDIYAGTPLLKSKSDYSIIGGYSNGFFAFGDVVTINPTTKELSAGGGPSEILGVTGFNFFNDNRIINKNGMQTCWLRASSIYVRIESSGTVVVGDILYRVSQRLTNNPESAENQMPVAIALSEVTTCFSNIEGTSTLECVKCNFFGTNGSVFIV